MTPAVLHNPPWNPGATAYLLGSYPVSASIHPKVLQLEAQEEWEWREDELQENAAMPGSRKKRPITKGIKSSAKP